MRYFFSTMAFIAICAGFAITGWHFGNQSGYDRCKTETQMNGLILKVGQMSKTVSEFEKFFEIMSMPGMMQQQSPRLMPPSGKFEIK